MLLIISLYYINYVTNVSNYCLLTALDTMVPRFKVETA